MKGNWPAPRREWDWCQHPGFNCEGLIFESELPLKIKIPPKSILRNSQVDVLKTAEDCLIIDSKILFLIVSNKSKFVNCCIGNVHCVPGNEFYNCSFIGNPNPRWICSVWSSDGKISDSIITNQNYALGFHAKYSKGILELENCLIWGRKNLGIVGTSSESENESNQYSDLKSMKTFIKIKNCLEQEPVFEKIDGDFFKSNLRLKPESPGYGLGIGAKLDENGFPIP